MKNEKDITKSKHEGSTSGKRKRKIVVSHVPPPVCSCTGVPLQCKGWKEDWFSICCTAEFSEYPLQPRNADSLKQRGRRMSYGVFEKLLERLAAEGHDLSRAIDLKDHWAESNEKKSKIIRNIDVSGVPPPVCSCTGVPLQCKGLKEGWFSICCTAKYSKYPLRPLIANGSKGIKGRMMSYGAFEKLLKRLAAEGYDLSLAVDLKDHWAESSGKKNKTKED